ncbi:hypothetical protein A1O7_06976 [Cladophialophora yegresii CBS 114405]|uniref:N(6)-L-threonylcarbamoyladenine synthase n=1 Tax=Cladophialophora yegresii CBS 114405 TaxID=1182544 RepID=W9VLP4_9EURO|nr:uncharacterized protein A1O7_06976 [Cladophialophora yegresii CBS 114405]EXJ56632.1 hypothetical protein A1O7_06976 [Cladophialophora yegresii CBS 114405]
MLHVCRNVRTSHSRCWHAASISVRRRNLLTLAIETSCDDTCVSILSTTNRHNSASADLLFDEKITAKNTGKGGILPTESLQSHQSNLSTLVESALPHLPTALDPVGPRTIWLRDGNPVQKPDFISVTRGPGMSANLGLGLATAKGLATAWQIPMVGVHHMQAHALTPRLVNAMGKDGQHDDDGHSPNFPFLTLLVSGGHTMLLHSKGLVDHEILATTMDTAVGDELDKCGRLLLPKEVQAGTPDTAFGKYLSAYAFRSPEDFASWRVPATRAEEIDKPRNEFGWRLSTPMAENRELTFSFSGIASQVKRLILARSNAGSMNEMERLLLARSALGAAFEHLGSRTVIALEKLRAEGIQIDHLVVSGGVAANSFLRYYLRELLDRRSFGKTQLVFPPVEFCTDNAAMIAWAGFEMFGAGYSTDLGCAPLRKWSMDSHQPGGGILGIGEWIRPGTQ